MARRIRSILDLLVVWGVMIPFGLGILFVVFGVPSRRYDLVAYGVALLALAFGVFFWIRGQPIGRIRGWQRPFRCYRFHFPSQNL